MTRDKAMSRRQFLRGATVGAGTLVMAACGAAPQTAGPTTQPAVAPTLAATAAATTAPAATALPSAAPSAFTLGVTPGSPEHARGWTTILPPKPEGMPFSPPITITSSRRLGNTRFYDNDTIENNPFTRFVRQELGIEWRAGFTWSDGPEGEQKLNLAIASGDLPDLLETVPLSIFATMLEADLVEDITEAYERVADPTWVKEPLARDNNAAWKYAEVNGRKMGLPTVATAAQNDKLLWIRKDWLEKVDMAPPTTLDELAQVALAFKQAELGQGDAGTTIGLGANKHLTGWYGSLDPVFGAFGVLPSPGDGTISDPWTREGDGLTYDPIRPAMKEALALLRQWYADGVLAQDFFTIQETDVAGLVGGNRVGLHFSPSFGGTYGPTDSLKNDPSAVWMFADIPAGPTGIQGKAGSDATAPQVFVFRKGTPHVEAVLKQTNWLAQLRENPENLLFGWEDYNYTWNGDKVELVDTGLFHPWFYGPVGTLGNAGMDPLREYTYFQAIEAWGKLPREQLNAYQALMLEDPSGLQGLRRQAYSFAVEQSEAQGRRNLFTGLPTPAMQEQGAQITSLLQETFLGIITGQQPLTAFDEMVTRWKAEGGDRITAEVNEWWAANRG